MSSIPDNVEPSIPTAPKEVVKQEITIKEITPVSEIPIISDVKVKEIIPSPGIEVAEYSSSKSPLIPREATTEKSPPVQVEITERPVIIEILPSSSSVFVPSASSPAELIASSSEISEVKTTNDSPPSKISLSTQDSINSEIYPSNEPVLGTAGSPSVIQEVIPVATTTKAPVIIEEEDTSLFDHNPAFPPIPDDLSVLSNHEDEMITDQNMDSEHVSSGHEILSVTTTTTESPIVPESPVTPEVPQNPEVPQTPETQATPEAPVTQAPVATEVPVTPETPVTTEVPVTSEVVITTIKEIPETPTPTVIIPETLSETVAINVEGLEPLSSSTKESPMLNLRSAIPTEILNVPSLVPEDITGDLDEATESSTSVETSPVATTTETPIKEEFTTSYVGMKSASAEVVSTEPSIVGIKKLDATTLQNVEIPSTKNDEEISSSTANSDVATEVTFQTQTELSSLAVETSDQNPHEGLIKDKSDTSSAGPTAVEVAPTKLLPVEPEVITVSRNSNTESQPFENVETTEFILTSFGSAESATELIKISPEAGKSAAIIESNSGKKNNVLTDLINLVGDVASISDHTDGPMTTRHVTGSPISDSEELIPVNAGYKSKNSNWNVNSITEVVPKSKYPAPVNKQKVIEIEDDEDGLTDSPPPNDKIEPTTRRPIIDNVSDDKPENKTDKKDIEIIGQAYMPNESSRPTKVVMKKNNEKPISEEVSASSEFTTESAPTSVENTTSAEAEVTSSEAGERIESSNSTSSSTPQ